MQRIAIFGLNPVSKEVLERLNPKELEINLVEQNPEACRQAREMGLKVTQLDFRNDEELKALGIGRDIRQIFCFLPQDSDNVFLTLSARALDKDLQIVATVEDPDCIDKLLAAGANKVIDPYKISARKFCDLINKPDITTMLDHTVFGRSDLNVAEILVKENSSLVGKKLSELRLNVDYNLIVIGILSRNLGDDFHFILGEQTHILRRGDILVVLGPAYAIRTLTKEVEYD